MVLTVLLLVDFRSHKAGESVTLAANTACKLITQGKAVTAKAR